MPKQTLSTFWHGRELSPLHRICLRSFVERGHRLKLYGYREVDVPDGVELEDARQVVAESELFEFMASYSGFSNIFRYALLLARDSWWVDTDVYCLADDIPDCRYAWAQESPGQINGAILRFPPGDPTLARILSAARAIGASVQQHGDLGPHLLTAHLSGFDPAGHFGSTEAFYPVDWRDVHRFWMPGHGDFVRSRIAGATFLHLSTMAFRFAGIDERVTPPYGSFLYEFFERAGGLDDLTPLDDERRQRTIAAIRTFTGKDSDLPEVTITHERASWMRRLLRRLA
jgi:hypothetical protein